MEQNVYNYYQYKKSKSKKNNHFTSIFLSIVILLSAIVYIKPKQSNLITMHYVEINNFQTYLEAKNLSQELMEFNCSPYVYFDGKYHVLLSYYSSKTDAEKVVSNLKNNYSSVCVFSIEFANFIEQKNLSKEQNLAVKNFINQSFKTIELLEKCLLAYSKKDESLAKIKTKILDNEKILRSAVDDLIQQFKTNSKYNIAKECAQTIIQSYSEIGNFESNTFENNLRYQIVNISINLLKFKSLF